MYIETRKIVTSFFLTFLSFPHFLCQFFRIFNFLQSFCRIFPKFASTFHDFIFQRLQHGAKWVGCWWSATTWSRTTTTLMWASMTWSVRTLNTIHSTHCLYPSSQCPCLCPSCSTTCTRRPSTTAQRYTGDQVLYGNSEKAFQRADFPTNSILLFVRWSVFCEWPYYIQKKLALGLKF